MGCKESKLAATTVEPVKKPKSASSRRSSRRIERLDSNTTTTTSVATTIAYNEKETNVEKGDGHKKEVKSKACQTTYYCLEGMIEDNSKSGLVGSNKGGNDVVVPKKETMEEERDEHDESLVFGEEDKKIELVMVEENENKRKIGEEMKEVETFEAREQEEVKIEEGETQNANDQVEATKVEEAQAGKSTKLEVDAKTMVAEEKGEAKDTNNKVEVAQVEEPAEPIEVETEYVVIEETENIVSSDIDDQVQAAKQDEPHDHDNKLSEVEAETAIIEDNGDASNVNDNVVDVEKEEVEPTKVEFGAKSEEETKIMEPANVDDKVSADVEKAGLIELEAGTLNEENITDLEA